MSLKGMLTSGVGGNKFPLLTLLNASGAASAVPSYVALTDSLVVTGYVYLTETLQ